MALDPLAVVRAAMAGEPVATDKPQRRMAGGDFSMSTVSPALRKLGYLYGIYLCFAVLRVQEVITTLAIPKLPMVMSLVLGVGVAHSVPGSGWSKLWRGIAAFRWQSLLVALAIVTVPFGIWMGQSLELLYPSYVISVTVFVVGLVLLRDRIVLTRVLQIVVGVLSLITIMVFFGIGVERIGSEGRVAVGVSLDPNDFAWILVTFVPIAMWLGVRNKATSILWFGTSALLVLGIVPTQSRGGMVSLLVTAAILVLFGASGWRRALIFMALGVLGAALLAYINTTGATRLTDFSGYEGGTGRMDLWTQGIQWMLQRPWGYGMGNYATYNVWMTRGFHGSHSAYIGIGVELGVAGLIAFGAIWASVLRGVARARRLAVEMAGDPVARAEATMCGFVLASMAGNAIGSMFLNTQYAALTLFMQAMGAAVIAGFPAMTSARKHHAVDSARQTHPHHRLGTSPIPLLPRSASNLPPRPTSGRSTTRTSGGLGRRRPA